MLEVKGERVYCGRPGCPRLMGTIWLGRLDLDFGPREGWVWQVAPKRGVPQVYWGRVYVLKRKRRPTIMTGGPVSDDAAQIFPGDDIECPRCRSRQKVPKLSA
jgi:hypothetical protein